MVTHFSDLYTRIIYEDFEKQFPLIAAKTATFEHIGLGEYEVECSNITDEDAYSVFIYDDLDKTLRRKTYLSSDDLSSWEWAIVFGYKLKRAMRFAGLSQEDLANELGVSRVTINRYINGKHVPNPLVIKKLAKILNCDVDVLTNF